MSAVDPSDKVLQNGITCDALIVLNGNIEDDKEVFTVIPTPKVLEMSCTTENMTDEGKNTQTYSSKLEEHSTLNEEGVVVTEKKYEESAIRTKSVKTDEGEVTTTSHILMKENEKLHDTDEGTEVAEYTANCTEKHRSSVSTIETIGDQQVTRVKSSEKTVSRNKKTVEEDDGDGGPKSITQATQKDEQMKENTLEKNEDAKTVVHRRSNTTKSERCETKVIGAKEGDVDLSLLEKHSRILQAEKSGTLIDLGAMGEIKLGSAVSESDTKSEVSSTSSISTLSHGLDELGSLDCNGAVSENNSCHDEVNEHPSKSSKERNITENKSISETSMKQQNSQTNCNTSHMVSHVAGDKEAAIMHSETHPDALVARCNGHAQCGVQYIEGSSSLQGSQASQPSPLSSLLQVKHTTAATSSNSSMAEENGHQTREESPSQMPQFKPDSRKKADDLVQRILAESRGDTSGQTGKVKIDMGDGDMKNSRPSSSMSSASNAASTNMEMSEMRSESSMKSESSMRSATSKMEASNYKSSFLTEAENTLSERAVGAERKLLETSDSTSEYSSVLEKRAGDKLEHIFNGGERRRPSLTSMNMVSESEASYAKKTYENGVSPAPNKAVFSTLGGEDGLDNRYAVARTNGRQDKDDFDELDHEINSLRQQYKDTTGKRNMRQFDDDELDEAGSGYGGYQGYGGHGQQQRGPMVRQGYVDDYGYDGYDEYGYPPPEYEEEYIPDEEFIPQKSEETEIKVKEKTESIRRMVNQQTTVIENFRRASESFDELDAEIRQLKQECLENQVKRHSIMGNEVFYEDDDMDGPVAPKPYVPGSYVRGSYKDRKISDPTPFMPAITDGNGMGGGYQPMRYNRTKSNSQFDGEEAELGSGYQPMRYNRTKSNSQFDREGAEETSSFSSAQSFRSKINRSKSMVDESLMDSSYQSSASQFEAGEDGSDVSSSNSRGPSSYSFRNDGSYGGRYGGIGDISSSPRLSYTSRFAGSSGSDDSSSNSRQRRIGRSHTLNDIDYFPSSNSQFSSRFLSKVRDDKQTGPGAPIKTDTQSRDKPFTSRFLRKSFDSGITSTGTSSFSSRVSSASTSKSEYVASTTSTSATSQSESAPAAAEE